ncbi:MAG: type II toxin-antitoxin system death-on-curing family toxin [Pyrinomonadaceae bacterium]|nr:type II toxin-antitoxin system death-on-curing family toxin [Pyrinomonadaceae bacterium]
MNNSELILYETTDGQTKIDVRLENETVWLTLNQIAELFERDKSVISRHLKNVFDSDELVKNSTVAKNATVQIEGEREVTREIEYFNLDAILSVGYRVNSKRGTQFRQWATNRLKDYLIKGYALNEKRLQENLAELETTIKVIKRLGKDEELKLSEAKGLLELISNYTNSFILLNRFDRQELNTEGLNPNITYEIEYNEAVSAVNELKRQLIEKEEATGLFGNQKDQSFAGVLGSIVQTFGGEYLYPTIEEQAAHLLYFVIKNHPFTDGNKRIGSFLFVWFLEKNKHRFNQKGELKISENALTALALLVAQSNPNDKELMIKLIINLISDELERNN